MIVCFLWRRYRQQIIDFLSDWVKLDENGLIGKFTGFGNNLIEEEHTIETLVRVLKEEIKFVHAFIIAFKQQDNR